MHHRNTDAGTDELSAAQRELSVPLRHRRKRESRSGRFVHILSVGFSDVSFVPRGCQITQLEVGIEVSHSRRAGSQFAHRPCRSAYRRPFNIYSVLIRDMKMPRRLR